MQSLKAAGAALLAWVIAALWLDAPLAYLAPWVALVMVNATVYRSIVKGVQQLVAVVVGLLAATGAYLLVGDRTLTLAIVLVVIMPLAYWRGFGDQGIYAATTAILVLTSGAPSAHQLVSRLLETGLGTLVGVGVNALIVPPVHLRGARRTIEAFADELAELLNGAAAALRETWQADTAGEWVRKADRTVAHAEDAWAAIERGRESLWLNPRRRRAEDPDPTPALPPLEVVAKRTASLQRTLVDAFEAGMPEPDRELVALYCDVLDHCADSVRAFRCRHFETPWPPPAGDDALRETDERLRERLRARRSGADGGSADEALCIPIDRLLTALDDLLASESTPAEANR
ncbi:FUSC family protein [Actinoallomurus rhizosphaericola]|uniref:FUSC family protein n=1 Tax=Actinoallomurus rhizosphaericola TaxID=2952536 RepID=UPI0020907FA4|nr:aromatic acid exporter family protein [Actinoallomurus rhizosphaericola]MCO5993093.1 aromatic acid exporter family protein [Actinoallomurus rhizosphaericola]